MADRRPLAKGSAPNNLLRGAREHTKPDQLKQRQQLELLMGSALFGGGRRFAVTHPMPVSCVSHPRRFAKTSRAWGEGFILLAELGAGVAYSKLALGRGLQKRAELGSRVSHPKLTLGRGLRALRDQRGEGFKREGGG